MVHCVQKNSIIAWGGSIVPPSTPRRIMLDKLLRPRPLLAHASTRVGTDGQPSTLIVRAWFRFDPRPCRLCPRCEASPAPFWYVPISTCVVEARGFVADEDAAFYKADPAGGR